MSGPLFLWPQKTFRTAKPKPHGKEFPVYGFH
jgi:hypothetical protein